MEVHMILLTGITGNIGGATARALLAKGVRFRALVRDVGKAAPWAEQGVELVQGDVEDPAAVKRALAGVDRALLVMPNGEHQERCRARLHPGREGSGPRLDHQALLARSRARHDQPDSARAHRRRRRHHGLRHEVDLRAPELLHAELPRLREIGARTTGKLSMPMGKGTVALTDNEDAGAVSSPTSSPTRTPPSITASATTSPAPTRS
jgi:hypothetical protein